MNNPKLVGQIRHILTTLGGVAVGFGYLSEGQLTEIVGAIAILTGHVMSFIAPEKR